MLLEYYFDFSCPYAYIGSTQIEKIAARHKADLVWRPMLLGGVFRAVKTPDFPAATMPPAKARHNALDMHRWAEYFDIPFSLPVAHPMRTVRALRALLALDENTWPPIIHALYRAYWVRGHDVTSEPTIAAVLAEAGVPDNVAARALLANDDDDIKQELRRRTDEAISRNIFGAPAMFVGTGNDAEFFWGQDRLHMVEKALQGWRPSKGDSA